jgi:5-methylthioadenosine/S-adenosylhomocysteine deaminase
MDDHDDRHWPAPEAPGDDAFTPGAPGGATRREFLKTGAAFAVGAAASQLPGAAAAESVAGNYRDLTPRDIDVEAHSLNARRRLVIKGGIVYSLDSDVGNFREADVLIEGQKIAAIGPNLAGQVSGDTGVIDAAGMIVMPGFITTHHHQYETLQRSIIPDGTLGNFAGGDWPLETYASVVQSIWTAGRLPGATPTDAPVWDLGRHPYDPEDNYISELVACLSEMRQGITMGADTSQAAHTPEHTDALIQGLKDSGRRSLFVYSGGTNRSADGFPYEYPGAPGDSSKGIGRLRAQFFNSDDQLVTLGFGGGATPFTNPDGSQTSFTGWQLAREFGAVINNHGVNPILAASDPRNGTDWSDVTAVHCTRWQDQPVAQISHSHLGYPNPATSERWEILHDRGAHASIAPLIEMQMGHGTPPFQLALNHGILPSLSPDVDTNMTPDPFSLMRGAFCLQRALAHELTIELHDPGDLPTPQLLTSRQVIEMVTIAGAAANRVLHKVGTLTPGKEADIVVLDAHNIDISPMNNVPGTIVTMMNPSHVRDVLVAGKLRVRRHKLVGWDLERLVQQIERSRNRVLRRIRGPAKGALPKGNNSSDPYAPNFFGSCCFRGQNMDAPTYRLRP